MNREIASRLKESALSIGPFFILILVMHFTGFFMVGSITESNADSFATIFTQGYYSNYYSQYAFTPSLLCFIIALPLMIVGMSFFGMGADQAMGKMGAAVGASLTKRRSIGMLVVCSLLLGTLITFAEPDLTIFSTQLMGESNKYTLIIIISVGVGILLAIAFVRVIYQWDFRVVLMFLFAIVFALGCLINRESFFPIIFDSSGVTVGSVSVPFILAMGISVAQIRGSKNAEDDSFGISGLASLGPLITVMIWAKVMEGQVGDDFGSIFSGLVSDATASGRFGPETYSALGSLYGSEALSSLQDVAIGMAPLTIMFFIYDFCFLHLDWKTRGKICVGLVETFLGLFVFMLGVNTGFMSIARQMGHAFGSGGFRDNFYAVILACILMGMLIILAEPSIHVLGKQVEEVSQGSIRSSELYVGLCIGVAMALVFSVLRVQYEISFMLFGVPLLIASLALALFSPKIFVALAFDSAGIASSTMASAFLMPMVLSMAAAKFGTGSSEAIENIISYGSGVLGMVYLCPLFSIQVLGAYGQVKQMTSMAINRKRVMEPDDSQVIHIPNGESMSQEVNRELVG